MVDIAVNWRIPFADLERAQRLYMYFLFVGSRYRAASRAVATLVGFTFLPKSIPDRPGPRADTEPPWSSCNLGTDLKQSFDFLLVLLDFIKIYSGNLRGEELSVEAFFCYNVFL